MPRSDRMGRAAPAWRGGYGWGAIPFSESIRHSISGKLRFYGDTLLFVEFSVEATRSTHGSHRAADPARRHGAHWRGRSTRPIPRRASRRELGRSVEPGEQGRKPEAHARIRK